MKKYIMIKCGKLFDGVKEEFQEGMEILIEGKRILKVEKNIQIEDAEIIDLTHLTVTPGLIDAHVHPDIMDWKTLNSEILFGSSKWSTLATARTAEKSLRRGFTTIRCACTIKGDHYLNDVRKAIECGYFIGSRMVTSALCATPGSHGDFLGQTFAMNSDFDMSTKSIFLGNGADFFRAAVRDQKKRGYNFIKIMATGGFATPNDSPDEKQLSDCELKAIIETAHDLGMTVTAHAYTAKLVKNLIEFGIDGIEHGAMIDEETARLMEEKDVYLVPTFCPYEEIVNLDEEGLSKKPEHFAIKLRRYSEIVKNSRKTIINSKIKLGYGTDFVAVHQPYESGYEYEAWMNNGIDCFRTLKAATSVNAEILQKEDIGMIAPGKYADISGWDRDLENDPKALLNCAFVMKDGITYATEKTE